MAGKYMLYEIRKWLRDPMMLFLLAYPVLLGLVVRLVLPVLEERFHLALTGYYPVILAGLMLLTAVITGAVIGFSILDDRDDNILQALDVSPVPFHVFMGFRFFLSFLLSYINTLLAVLLSGLGGIPLYALLLVPISISLFSSVSAMFINMVATNKVEGFAVMKGSAIIIIFPIAAMFFHDYKEFFFAFEPNFWAVKALAVSMQPGMPHNMGFLGYYPVGLVFVLGLNLLIYRFFRRRIMI